MDMYYNEITYNEKYATDENKKIEFIFDAVPTEILGKDLVNTVVLKNIKTDKLTNLDVNGVFPYVGYSPNIDGFNGQIKQDDAGFIITDETMQTSVAGVFAVGDVRNTPLRQVITAASDGAVGAVYAVKYLEKMAGILV